MKGKSCSAGRATQSVETVDIESSSTLASSEDSNDDFEKDIPFNIKQQPTASKHKTNFYQILPLPVIELVCHVEQQR